VNYQKAWLFIKFIGTHAEYDKVDAATVDVYRKRINKV
jgi:mRNA interferase HigB